MQAKAFNSQAFLEFLCFFIFGGLLLYLAKSGKYLSYVTPRMEPYIYFASIVMGIWALTGFCRLFRPQHRLRSSHCLVVGIPILLLLLPHSPLTTSSLTGNYSNKNAFSASAGQELYSKPDEASLEDSIDQTDTSSPAEDELSSADTAVSDTVDTAVADAQSAIPEEQASVVLPGLDTANKKIIVSNDDFSMWLTEIYINIEKYTGYTIDITGYVFKNPDYYNDDEFVPARLMMSCCVADLVPVGLTCKYDNVSELEEGSWVTVEGTLHVGQYEYDGEQYEEPQISVTQITPAEEVSDYVYPFY
ncbi:TIGR03943 family putative permease subunit [Kineothrix sedimenti]|uniref:TIGR03943 family protein n=1 Tax=Kineothrix sedimenti TaxID=3123317 RepID=A0ABZ3EYP7_9FIRM